MPNYKEQEITGTSWTRSYRATCDNSGDRKSVWFDEEVVVRDPEGNKLVGRKMGMGCGLELTPENASTLFNLLDINGDITGNSLTYQQAYLVLMSLYYHAVNLRDQQAESNV